MGLAVPLGSLTFGPPSSSSSAAPAKSPATRATDPGRVLTAASARLVINDVGKALSSAWRGNVTVTTSSAAASAAPTQAISPAACRPLAREEFVNVLQRARVGATGQFRAITGVIPIGTATLTMMVESYSRPVPAALFAAASQDLRACRHFTVAAPEGTTDFTVHAVPAPSLGSLSWRADLSLAFKHQRSSVTLIFVSVGHNLIMLDQQTVAFGALLPLQQTAINAALNAAMSGLSQGS
jgi:hypothetical protein